jgi:uncharacterized membrane protein YbhN (UPF0104 family)
MVTNEEIKHAAIGAVVTILTSFVPLSPILGGAVAAYLHERDGPRIGALSGGIAAIPFVGFGLLLALLFGGVGLFGGLDVLAFGAVVILLFLFGLVFAVAISAILGGVGGWIGIYVLEETDLGHTRAAHTSDPHRESVEPSTADAEGQTEKSRPADDTREQ